MICLVTVKSSGKLIIDYVYDKKEQNRFPVESLNGRRKYTVNNFFLVPNPSALHMKKGEGVGGKNT